MEETAIQVRKRGVVTLPADLREKHNIQEGDTLRVIDLEGVFVLTRKVSLVPELAQELERLRLEAGVTTEEMLAGLREQRERYYAENYEAEE